MKVIGLTGPSGAGKTLFCKFAERCGVPSIDADRIYHDLLVPPSSCLDEIVAAFGREVLSANGTLNRAALAALVFGPSETSRAKLALLNRITHKYVTEKIRARLKEEEGRGTPAVLVDAPALFESEFDKSCDCTVALLATPETRRKRIMERDSLSGEKADQRILAQPSDDFYIQRSDFVIRNTGSEKELSRAVEAFLSQQIQFFGEAET